MRWSRLIVALRLVPALVWVSVQFAMAAPVLPTAEALEKSRVVNALGVSDIPLCAPGGDRSLGDDGPSDPERCPWCQAFDEAALPRGPAALTLWMAASDLHRSLPSRLGDTGYARAAYDSRAPPS